MYNWKDISCYSQGDKERIPNNYEFIAGRINVHIHRHRDYGKYTWLVSCYNLGVERVVLNHKDTKKAMVEALAYVNGILKQYSQSRNLVEKEMKLLIDAKGGISE